MSKSTNKAAKVDDIWSKLESENSFMNAEIDQNDVTVLFIGESQSGKSSLLQSFLQTSTKAPKPTFALEYNYVRKKQVGTAAASKSISHIWELGGGIFEPRMLDIPLKHINNSTILISCDLSQPNNIVVSLLKWITYIKDITNTKMNEYLQSNNSINNDNKSIGQLRSEIIQKYYGPTHQDKLRIVPCLIPTYILLTKYDVFKSNQSVDCKLIYQVIRFIAHYHGISVITCSTAEAHLKDSFKTNFSNICFNSRTVVPSSSVTSSSNSSANNAANNTNNTISTCLPVISKLPLQVNAESPLFVTCGKDNFKEILNFVTDTKVRILFIILPIYLLQLSI